MARKARIPTQAELEAIVELKSKGKSDEEVSKALGISRSTFAKWKKLAYSDNSSDTVNTHVAQAIKLGMDARREKHLAMAVDAVDELLSTYTYEEKTTISKLNMATGEMYDEVKIVEKRVKPNPMITIFTLVNRDSENFRSINHPIEKDDDDEMPDGVELEFDE